MSALSSPSPLDRILELKDEVEKQKVELTPGVKAYIQTHLEMVQEKLRKGEAVTEDDMKFIHEAKLMIDALKRKISIRQWKDLLHVANAAGKSNEWIDEEFHFPGEGRIVVHGSLDLRNLNSLGHLPKNLNVEGVLILFGCSTLTYLPEHLTVKDSLMAQECTSLRHVGDYLNVGGDLHLSECSSLVRLPENLTVGGKILLGNSASLTSLPLNLKVESELLLSGCSALTHLPENLRFAKNPNVYLGLLRCTSLSHLPENLKVPGILDLRHCDSLSHLPDELEVGGNLVLSDGLQKTVKEDVKRLKKAGKIKGEIDYYA